MDTRKFKVKALCATLIRVLTFVQIVQADVDTDDWQHHMLWNPSDSQQQREKDGKIMIYHGLSDKTVEKVMDSKFKRLSSMMFTGVIVTDQYGEALIDPDTNEVVVEDDGCDQKELEQQIFRLVSSRVNLWETPTNTTHVDSRFGRKIVEVQFHSGDVWLLFDNK